MSHGHCGGTASLSLVAVVRHLLAKRKHRTCFDLDISYNASSASLVGEPDIIASRRDAGDPQPLIEIDAAIRIVPTLIGAPMGGPRRREEEMCDRLARQVPEPGDAAVGRPCRTCSGNDRAGGYDSQEYNGHGLCIVRSY